MFHTVILTIAIIIWIIQQALIEPLVAMSNNNLSLRKMNKGYVDREKCTYDLLKNVAFLKFKSDFHLTRLSKKKKKVN